MLALLLSIGNGGFLWFVVVVVVVVVVVALMLLLKNGIGGSILKFQP